MSGGSFNYLYCKEPRDLFDWDCMESMEGIEAFLINEGYTDVAKDTRRLIEYVKSAEIRISVLQEQLADVFKAVEWYVSADYGRDTLEKKIAAYRAGKVGTEPVEPLRWIDDRPGIKCPVCGFTCDDEYYLGRRRYCPDCGQKLEKEVLT